ncbi:MAG: acyl-phosphate glycerol 3-phosphate acyltransferase [Odoribacter sp.]|nr:acyl-phosphate glycerol 3-phosphate acyltransferase [Odoribacter sp.]
MNIPLIVIAFILAYLLGSIPTSVWVGKIFHGIDVREHGSGNAGATNVIRVLGWKTGIPVMITDVGKGWLAAYLPVLLNLAEPGSGELTTFQILTGLTSIVGHVFPVLAGFRGGKGVGSTFGVLLSIHPLLTLSCLGVFLLVLFITGYVSVSSMSAGLAFPILLFIVFDTPSLTLKIFSVFVAVALILTHRKNITRLLKGEESKFIKRKQKG